jgi:hypothetical protein
MHANQETIAEQGKISTSRKAPRAVRGRAGNVVPLVSKEAAEHGKKKHRV